MKKPQTRGSSANPSAVKSGILDRRALRLSTQIACAEGVHPAPPASRPMSRRKVMLEVFLFHMQASSAHARPATSRVATSSGARWPPHRSLRWRRRT